MNFLFLVGLQPFNFGLGFPGFLNTDFFYEVGSLAPCSTPYHEGWDLISGFTPLGRLASLSLRRPPPLLYRCGAHFIWGLCRGHSGLGDPTSSTLPPASLSTSLKHTNLPTRHRRCLQEGGVRGEEMNFQSWLIYYT